MIWASVAAVKHKFEMLVIKTHIYEKISDDQRLGPDENYHYNYSYVNYNIPAGSERVDGTEQSYCFLLCLTSEVQWSS